MTRKEFLQTLAALGVATAGGALATSCGGGGGEQQASTPPQSKPQPSGGTAGTKTAAADPCADDSALTVADRQMKETLKYTATSPEAEKLCDNCKFWTPPAAGAACGACQLIKGPIHPKGYCSSWFTREEA